MDFANLLTEIGRTKLTLSYDWYLVYPSFLGILCGGCALVSFIDNNALLYGSLAAVSMIVLTVFHPIAKPFLVLLLFGYVLVIPTCASFYLGFGREGSMESQVRVSESSFSRISFSNFMNASVLLATSRDYFEVSDGFIAFNLSKSVVHTVNPYPVQPEDSLYFGLTNPLTDQVYGSKNVNYSNLYVSEVPLFSSSNASLFQDIISQWTVAPIFASKSDCLLSPPPVHITCVLANEILGWAVASDTSSFCRIIKSSACSMGGVVDQKLSVYYPIPFDESTPPTLGFSGMYSKPPPDFFVEAIIRRYVADGWPLDFYPTLPVSIWVRPIAKVAEVMEQARWEYFRFKIVSIVLAGIVVLLVATAFGLDLYTDLLVMRLVDRQRKLDNTIKADRLKREDRKIVLNSEITDLDIGGGGSGN